MLQNLTVRTLRRSLGVLMVCLCLSLGGCSYLGAVKHEIGKLSGAEAAKDKEIAALQADFSQKLAAKDVDIKNAREGAAKTVDAQLAAAAGAFYAQDLLYQSIPSPIRRDIVMHMVGEEGWAALSHRLPTYETMQKINERLKNDLDETKTSLADLQKTHLAAMTDAAKVSDAAKAAAGKLADLEKAKSDMEADYKGKLAKKEGERAALADQRADLEKARSDDAAAIQAMKMKLSLIAGGLALACIAGAIYSPVGKGGLAVFGAICGLASVGIWYITGPVVLGAVVIGVVAVAGWGLYKHNASDKTVSALTGYLHDKGQLAEADLAAWTTKYVKNKDGTVVTVPDKAVQAAITDKLVSTNKL